MFLPLSNYHFTRSFRDFSFFQMESIEAIRFVGGKTNLHFVHNETYHLYHFYVFLMYPRLCDGWQCGSSGLFDCKG